MSEPLRREEANALLSRLLGPVGPELSCEACFERLHEFVELELTGRDTDAAVPGMRAHLAGCSACAEDRLTLREFVRGDTGETVDRGRAT